MIHETLPVALTDDELIHRGNSLAEIMATIDALEHDKKTSAAEFKLKIDEQTEIATQIARNIRSKSEMRLVECEDQYDYSARRINRVRVDTGEIVNSRPMGMEDIQGQVFDDRHEGKIAYLGDSR